MSNEKKNPTGAPESNESQGYPYPNLDYGSYFPYYSPQYAPYTRAAAEAEYPGASPQYTTGGYQPSYPGYGTGTAPTYGTAPTGYGTTPYPPVETGYGVPSAPPSGGYPGTAAPGQTGVEVPGLLPSEQSYVENILRLNLGKIATVYMTFENNREWNAKVFQGKLQAAGRDHIILSDPDTDRRYLLLMVYVDYITFEGPMNYSYPYE